jgi:hypothetical protein
MKIKHDDNDIGYVKDYLGTILISFDDCSGLILTEEITNDKNKD